MPSKQETGTSSLPESRLKSPSSGVFESLAPVPGDYRLSKKPPIKQQIKKRRIKNEERIVNFQRPIGQR
jgi:hypothetical protein